MLQAAIKRAKERMTPLLFSGSGLVTREDARRRLMRGVYVGLTAQARISDEDLRWQTQRGTFAFCDKTKAMVFKKGNRPPLRYGKKKSSRGWSKGDHS